MACGVKSAQRTDRDAEGIIWLWTGRARVDVQREAACRCKRALWGKKEGRATERRRHAGEAVASWGPGALFGRKRSGVGRYEVGILVRNGTIVPRTWCIVLHLHHHHRTSAESPLSRKILAHYRCGTFSVSWPGPAPGVGAGGTTGLCCCCRRRVPRAHGPRTAGCSTGLRIVVLRADFRPLSSCRDPQAAVKRSYCRDKV